MLLFRNVKVDNISHLVNDPSKTFLSHLRDWVSGFFLGLLGKLMIFMSSFLQQGKHTCGGGILILYHVSFY